MLKRLSYTLATISTMLIPQRMYAWSLLDNLSGGHQTDELSSIGVLISNISSIILTIAGSIALVMIIVGGLRYITSAGNPDSLESAKKTLTYAIIGLLLVIFSFAIVKIFATFIGGNLT